MDEYIQLENEFIVIAIPASTLEVNISAKIWDNGQVKTVARTLPFNDVRDAIREAQDGYIPHDAIFVLAPNEPKEKLERLIKTYLDKNEEDNQ